MELFKWLDGSNRLLLLDILNQWWKEGGVPKEVLHARVVPIFKKGDIDDPSNYRPISLLNSIYKLFTALVRARIQSAVEFKVSPLYWKNSSAGKKWQLIIHDAVIRSKLLYNLETMCLTQSLRKKLDTFHLRGLRKILQVPRTYVDRRYTNARVYELATQIAYPDDPYKSVRPFSAILDEKRTHLAGHILRAANSDPLRQVVYEPNTATVKRIGKRRVGRPRINWAYNINELIHSRGNATDYVASIDQDNNILEFAKQRFI